MNNYLIPLFCYFIGSLPFSIVLTRLFTGLDPREQGSGNIGFSNVMRSTQNKYISLLIGTIDISKGIASALLGGYIGATAAMLGQIFPLWLGFRGGKGIAILIGSLLTAHWSVAIIIPIWFLLSKKTYPVVGSLMVIGVYFVLLAINSDLIYLLPGVLVSLVKHKGNIFRLITGQEKKL